jgi:hypothetical protein
VLEATPHVLHLRGEKWLHLALLLLLLLAL